MPYQSLDLPRCGLTRSMASRAAWWIAPDGSLHRGAAAFGQMLQSARWPWPVLARWLLIRRPMRWFAALVYELVVRIRGHLPATVPACDKDWRPQAFPPAHEAGTDRILLPRS